MPTDICMPAISPTMEKGTLARWLVDVGSRIKTGEVIAEIETDKASVELESEADGVLTEIVVGDGTADVPVGSVLARVSDAEGASVAPGPARATPTQKPAAVEEPAATTAGEANSVAGPPSRRPSAPPSSRPSSPIARRLARQLGIDLDSVTGSGPRGRVLKSDIEALDPRLHRRVTTEAPAADVIHPPPHDVPRQTEPLSAMRKTIARRLGESKRSVPHFYMSADVPMDALLALRAQSNEGSTEPKLSVNDFVVRACALALRDVPEANVQFGGDVVHRFERVDISVAVAVDDGLYTPVIRDAANKSLRTISSELRSLAARAREGKLHPMDYEGGTFSISNLGMYGVKQFEAVINPPQAGILAVGAVAPRAEPVGDAVEVRQMATLTLSCDHRIIDGAVGARLLQSLVARLSRPLEILLS